jgi:hypothetical protein
MKRIFAFLLINIFLGAAMVAQDETAPLTSVNALTSKRGMAILPAAGDFAIGMDALPVFQVFGQYVQWRYLYQYP